MKILRQIIRNLILESACDSANAKIKSGIDYLEKNGYYIEINDRVSWFQRDMTKEIGIHLYNNQDYQGIAGEFYADKTYEGCYGSFVVDSTRIDEELRGTGVGALIYDIAVELAAKNGIASDRRVVSNMAFPMYEYMKNNPDLYNIKPIDATGNDGQGVYTPGDPWDDCHSMSWFDYDKESRRKYDKGFPAGWDWENIPRDIFISSPLNNVYVKKDQSMPTVKCLQEKGLLKVQ